MATYKIKGQRWLRKYTAKRSSPVYAAAVDAQTVVDSFCEIPWESVFEKDAGMTYHTDEVVDEESKITGLDKNVLIRNSFDAALFCAGHVGGQHRAYANAAVYRYEMPTAAIGLTLSSISIQVTSDPYNSRGVRLHVFTNSTGEIPMNCHTLRGEDSSGEIIDDGTTAAAVAPRTVETRNKTDYWYPTVETATLSPTGGMTLQKYLFVLVALESYSTVRGNWMEGSSFIKNAVEITLPAPVSGWSSTEVNDLSDVTDDSAAFNVTRGGVCQSVIGSVSGVFGVEVLKTGDSLDDLAYSPDGIPGVAGVVSNIADTVTNLKTSYSANVKFVSCMTQDYTTPSIDPTWGQYVIAFADAQFWSGQGGSGAYMSMRRTGKVANVFLIDGTNKRLSFQMDQFSEDDVAAGVAFAWIEGRQNSAALKIHVITRNGVEVTSNAYPQTDQAWYSVGGDTRTTGVSTPCCICQGYPVYLGSSSITGSGLPSSISFSGTVTSVRCKDVPIAGTQGCTSVLVVSGDLTMVGGVPVKNCAIVTVADGTATVTRPTFDSAITPDAYDGYSVSPVMPRLLDVTGNVNDVDEYIVTGSFSHLSGIAINGCAMIDSSGKVAEKELAGPDGRLSFISSMLAICGDVYFYQGSTYNAIRVYPYDAISRALATNITEEQSCIGLRALYAKLYMGAIKPVTVASIGYKRFGAGFSISTGDKSVYSYDGSDVLTVNSVPVYRMSMSALAIPFSTPIDFVARKIRLDWSSFDGSVTGGRFNVWLKNGEYVDELPENVLVRPEMYIGAKSVAGWNYVGSVDVSDGSTYKVFDLDEWLNKRLATLMFTAFVSMDDVNPSAETEFPQGVVTEFSVDPNVGSIIGDGSLWNPDITLIE